ncbi:zinc finger, CCHC-type containing protein [Tanacetum coccineum]
MESMSDLNVGENVARMKQFSGKNVVNDEVLQPSLATRVLCNLNSIHVQQGDTSHGGQVDGNTAWVQGDSIGYTSRPNIKRSNVTSWVNDNTSYTSMSSTTRSTFTPVETEIPDGNNVVPLRSDTMWLVQNGCSFYGLRSKDPNQHLKDFLKLVDSLDLDVANRERTRLLLFQFSLCNQAINWLERLPAGSISTWEDLTTHFLAQFFPSGRTAKLQNDILMFQQHQRESLSKA